MTSHGITATERYLNRLARRSFLRLWSYPSLYRDQGVSTRGEGAELCDLLVVFERHVLIFSDKDCVFPEHDDPHVAWSRWFKRAVLKSAQQVWGAERWIRGFPNRIFVDRACAIPFPLPLPEPGEMLVHRIVVAHDTSGRRAALTGGSGTLLINPAIRGATHFARQEEGGHPFAIGQLDPSRGYVHVLDERSLGIVLTTLDTITDFTNYLTRKERFIRSGRLHGAFGEEDLLAFYLKDINEDTGDHDFIVPDGRGPVLLEEGQWANYQDRPEVARKLSANRTSYLWDEIIDEVAKNALSGTLHFALEPSPQSAERLLRVLAREPRVRRRMLARSVFERVTDPPPPGSASFRTVYPSEAGDPHYVIVVLTPEGGALSDEAAYLAYRDYRRELLQAYLEVAMEHFADAEAVVGYATEGGLLLGRSHDLAYVRREDWNEDRARAARELKAATGWFRKMRVSRGREEEYPEGPSALGRYFHNISFKTGRNDPCPCGSGKKFKRCHGA